jgi:hypothetical protein
MPILLILLLIGVFAYLYWQRRTTTLTRNCRWRQTAPGHWWCAYCGAETDADKSPIVCLQQIEAAQKKSDDD